MTTYFIVVEDEEADSPHNKDETLKESFIKFLLENELNRSQHAMIFPLSDGIILRPRLSCQMSLSRAVFKSEISHKN